MGIKEVAYANVSWEHDINLNPPGRRQRAQAEVQVT